MRADHPEIHGSKISVSKYNKGWNVYENMTLKEIAVACGGIYYGDDESYYKEVSSVVIDSRKVEKDCLFIAIRGTRVDGHMFIPQTIRDGALCALSENGLKMPLIHTFWSPPVNRH